jgi:hypothetical protein
LRWGLAARFSAPASCAGFLPAIGSSVSFCPAATLFGSILADASAQRFHQVKDVAGSEPLLPRDRLTRALLVDEID